MEAQLPFPSHAVLNLTYLVIQVEDKETQLQRVSISTANNNAAAAAAQVFDALNSSIYLNQQLSIDFSHHFRRLKHLSVVVLHECFVVLDYQTTCIVILKKNQKKPLRLSIQISFDVLVLVLTRVIKH